MSPAILFLTFIIVQRLSELVIAKRNTARLMAEGAREIGAAHYPAMVAMHTAWIAALVVFGWQNPVSLPWLMIFAVLQGLRLWILTTLGPRWTTRIIITDTPLVNAGPFRYLRHPNYTLVVAEIIVAPMVLGLVWVAVLWTILNAAMLFVRIRAENAGLAPHRD
ncbi:isoprenylcysteine carboxyl methyltransferase family protein [Litoreibacter janthinus]|uniref:Methyltransferase n=1 Tax=Litoreibacter janthinus TaxID=670154 RepID=A0A1I6H4E2_9RHOB|nr:isoprenylcysteine carboxylmethyltransferase family protein [Litoreibacter janthinus]SFR49293.1 methyltransferase [Litoreibacter janthinus]